MWKAIRLHPWRLEIVPAAAFGFAVWSACVAPTPSPELQRGGYYSMTPVGLGMVLLLWMFAAGSCHRWVQSERRKRFNWSAIILPLAMLFNAWLLYSQAQMVWLIKHPLSSLPYDARILVAVLVGGTGLAAVLEWSRPYVERPETPEPALPTDAADASSYRETSVDWWAVPCVPMILAMGIWWYMQSKSLEDLLILGVAGLVLASMSIRTLLVTPATLICRLGFPSRFNVADILSCVPAHQEPYTRRRDRTQPFGITDGRCIEITLNDGRIYRLGALRPNHICQLIGKPPADEPKAES